MSRWQRYPRPPRNLRRAKLDNIALVPASLLPYRALYQAIANRLPHQGVLIVLPEEHTKERQTLTKSALLFADRGHPVATLSITKLSRLTAKPNH